MNVRAEAADSVGLIRKSHSTQDIGDGLEYVLSDETIDRLGDIIAANGWDLKWFRENPIALFGHMGSFPIGHWEHVRIENKQLRGKMVIAESGTSPRIDELRNLVRQKILRTVSVGFLPRERKYRREKDEQGNERTVGIHFLKQELLECSLVSIPANPNALQIAKSLNTSHETMQLAFGEIADMTEAQFREFAGKPAEIWTSPKDKTMSTLAQRIQAREAHLTTLKTKLAGLAEKIGDAQDDALETEIANTNTEIAGTERQLGLLRTTEQSLGEASPPVTTRTNANGGNGQATFGQSRTSLAPGSGGNGLTVPRVPWAVPKQPDPKPRDFLFRSAAVKLLCHIEKKSPADVLRERFGEGDIADVTKGFLEVILRAATAPADTTTSGWASQLVNTAIADFFDTLMPLSVYPGLSSRGLRLTFGRNGVVSIPTRSSTPTIAGSFVAQGSPIPVRQGAFAAVTMTPKKLGVISTFTREIAEHSTPSIEELIRQAMTEDTAVAVDSVLLDANAATTIRPAGIRNGVTGTTASVLTNNFDKLVADIKALLGALITGTNGNIRAPVWIMNPIQALAIGLTQNAGGDFPFGDEIQAGNLRGYPVLQSTNVTAGMLILVDAADFASVTGDEPKFDVSDQAVIHMEDTTPLAIGTAGSPNTVAAPVRSLWQTDSIGIRMLLDMNWLLRRTGVVAFIATVGW